MDTTIRWRKIGKVETAQAEAFLREEERFCVSACSKFLHKHAVHDKLWALWDSGGTVSALLMRSGRILFPIFGGSEAIPRLPFGVSFPGRVPAHAIHGLRKDVETLERAFLSFGYRVMDGKDYDLLALDGTPNPDSFRAGPPGLVLRKPEYTDMDSLFLLQSAYEQEEVLPQGAVFNPASCRLSLEHTLAREQMLAAELGGRLVGKINTNALSFSRYQIGGVYVLPGYRGRGIALRMIGVFTDALISQGKGVTLFVKKQNPEAQAVYRRAGFTWQADYRICYY
jgi:ribosomal protein S18 acetylase RimI-like enzyme